MSVKGINERNRANAQKSTGPKTEEGKRISRSNAQKHGLCSEILFVEGDYGKNTLEDMREYIDTMLERRYEELNPQTWEEVFLAKQIMGYEYRLLRCPSIEAEQLRALREASAALYSKPGCYRDADEPDKDQAQAHLRVVGIYTFLSSVYRYEKSLFSMLRETRLLYETRQAKRAYDHWRYPPGQPMLRVKSPEELAADPSSPFTAVTLGDIERGNSPGSNQPDVLIIRERDLPNFKLTGGEEEEGESQAKAVNASGGVSEGCQPTHNAQRTTHRPPEGPGVEVPRSGAGGGTAAGMVHRPTNKEHEEAAGLPAPWDGAKQSVAQAGVPMPAETGAKPPKVFLRNEPKQPETADFGPSETQIQPLTKPDEVLRGTSTSSAGDPNSP